MVKQLNLTKAEVVKLFQPERYLNQDLYSGVLKFHGGSRDSSKATSPTFLLTTRGTAQLGIWDFQTV